MSLNLFSPLITSVHLSEVTSVKLLFYKMGVVTFKEVIFLNFLFRILYFYREVILCGIKNTRFEDLSVAHLQYESSLVTDSLWPLPCERLMMMPYSLGGLNQTVQVWPQAERA